MVFLLAALRFAGGLGTWMLYSRIVKMAVQPAARSNAIVSQTRLEGNATIMQQLAESIPSTQINASKYDTLVWGTNDACSGGNVKKLGKYLILDSSDDNSLSIFASCKIPQESLRTLIGSKRRGKIVADPFQFRIWMEALADSVPIKPTFNLLGKYSFSFRDYWNFEEANGVERASGSVSRLKFRSSKTHPTDELMVHENGNCALTAHFFIHGVVPLSIQWEGKVNKDTITWSRSMIRKGWKRLGKTIDRPPVAEKLRQQPWVVRMPSQDDSGDVLVLERKGIGRLAFARDCVFP